MVNVTSIVLSLFGSVTYGITHGILYLVIEPYILKHFEELPFFDESMAELTTSGVSHGITLLIVASIMYGIKKKYEITELVFLDIIGILFGISLVLIGYYIYNKNNSSK